MMVETKINSVFIEVNRELIFGTGGVNSIKMIFQFKGDRIIMNISKEEYNEIIKQIKEFNEVF